jgi:hypothetical protein
VKRKKQRSRSPRDTAPSYGRGTRFGLVTIVGLQPPGTHPKGRTFRVRCDCGDERVVLASSLRQRPPETHRSCGDSEREETPS